MQLDSKLPIGPIEQSWDRTRFEMKLVNPAFQEGLVYDNLIATFSRVPVSIAYIFALTLLCIHLYHGIYSMFQSLGLSHPKYTPAIQRAAKVASILIWAGYVSIPIAVLTKVIS